MVLVTFVVEMRCKALLLLSIFLLNTVTGFSCALRMSHDEHSNAAESHNHQHEHVVIAHHPLSLETTVDENDPCCQGAVNNFVSLAKLVPSSSQTLLQVPFICINSFFQISFKSMAGIISVRSIQMDERRRPPTGNIRIAIQSFQI